MTIVADVLDVLGPIGTPVTFTGTAALSVTDAMSTIRANNAATAITITLQQANLVGGRVVKVGREVSSTGAVTIACAGGSTVQALAGTYAATTTLAAVGAYGGRCMFQADSVNNRWMRLT